MAKRKLGALVTMQSRRSCEGNAPAAREFEEAMPGKELAARLRLISLRRSFPCAGRIVFVTLAALRTEDLQPNFEVVWMPSRPDRLTPNQIADFDRAKAQSIRELRLELERYR